MGPNVKVTGAARLHRAASAWTEGWLPPTCAHVLLETVAPDAHEGGL